MHANFLFSNKRIFSTLTSNENIFPPSLNAPIEFLFFSQSKWLTWNLAKAEKGLSQKKSREIRKMDKSFASLSTNKTQNWNWNLSKIPTCKLVHLFLCCFQLIRMRISKNLQLELNNLYFLLKSESEQEREFYAMAFCRWYFKFKANSRWCPI